MLRLQLQRTYVYSVRLLVHVLIHVHVHILGVLGCCASALDDQLPENGGAGTEYVVDRCCSCRYAVSVHRPDANVDFGVNVGVGVDVEAPCSTFNVRCSVHQRELASAFDTSNDLRFKKT